MAQHRITYVFVIHLITALASLAILLLLVDHTTAVAIDHDSRNVAMSDRHLDNGQSPPTPAEISDASLSRVAHMLPRPKIPKFRPLLIEEQLTCDGNDACNRMFGMLEKLSEYMKEIDVNRMFHQYERIVCLRSFFGGPICAYLEGTNRGVVGTDVQELFRLIQQKGCEDYSRAPIRLLKGFDDSIGMMHHGMLMVNSVEDDLPCSGVCWPPCHFQGTCP